MHIGFLGFYFLACATTPPAARVSERLQTEWTRRYRVTTVEQSAAMIATPFSDDLRQQVRTELSGYRPDRGSGRSAYEWREDIYLLTNDERLIGRYVIHQAPSRTTSPTEVAHALDLEESVAASGMNLLAQLGFLNHTDTGYRLAPGWERMTEGLGLIFHEVVAQGERFNVQ